MSDPYCSSCHELLSGNEHRHHFDRPLCDDCLFDATGDNCQTCGDFIAGGNPFSTKCDTCLERTEK